MNEKIEILNKILNLFCQLELKGSQGNIAISYNIYGLLNQLTEILNKEGIEVVKDKKNDINKLSEG
jgi:hypothetical protein